MILKKLYIKVKRKKKISRSNKSVDLQLKRLAEEGA